MRLLVDLGSIFYQQGQLAKARELYEQARDSGDPAALVGLGHIYDLDNSEFIDFDEFNQPIRLRIQDAYKAEAARAATAKRRRTQSRCVQSRNSSNCDRYVSDNARSQSELLPCSVDGASV